MKHFFLGVCLWAAACGDPGHQGLPINSTFPTTDSQTDTEEDTSAVPDTAVPDTAVSDTGPPVGCVAGQACDDGNACTENDTCVGTTCQGTPMACDDGVSCTSDSCANGFCVYTVNAGECFIEKVCYAEGEANPINACQVCTSALNKELWTTQATGVSCDDGDDCTQGDTCTAAGCSGTPVVCPDDGNACTAETCVAGACQTTPIGEGGSCDDGNPCSVGDICFGGVCQAGAQSKDEDTDGAIDKACGGTDCDDTNSLIKPGVSEACGDGVDNDCNGQIDMVDPACADPGPVACQYHLDCYPEKVCAIWTVTGEAVCSVPCGGLSDCQVGETCSKLPGSANVGFCEAAIPGGKNMGAPCQQGLECATGLCLENICAAMCLNQSHCVGGICTLIGNPAGGYISSACSKGANGFLNFGAACTDGNEYSGDFCASAHCDLAPAAVNQLELSTCAPLCKTRADCGPKQECNLVLYASVPAEGIVLFDPQIVTNPALAALKTPRDTATACYSVLVEPGQQEGALPDGTPCDYNAQCTSRLCMAFNPGDPTAYCTNLCVKDTDCGAGMACKLEMLSLTSMYLKHVGPLIGTPIQQNVWTYGMICKFK